MLLFNFPELTHTGSDLDPPGPWINENMSCEKKSVTMYVIGCCRGAYCIKSL
jgi:hypothetical protein